VILHKNRGKQKKLNNLQTNNRIYSEKVKLRLLNNLQQNAFDNIGWHDYQAIKSNQSPINKI